MRLYAAYFREYGVDEPHCLDARVTVVVAEETVVTSAKEIWGSVPEDMAVPAACDEEAKAKLCRWLRQPGVLEKVVGVSPVLDRKVVS